MIGCGNSVILKSLPLVLVAILSSCDNTEKPNIQSKPVTLSVINYSHSKLKESIEIWINDVLLIRSESTKGEITYFLESNDLQLRVNTWDGKLALDTMLTIPKNSEGLNLVVGYNNALQTENAIQERINKLYYNTLKHNRIEQDTLIPWLKDSLHNQAKRLISRLNLDQKASFRVLATPLPITYDCGSPFMH